MSAIEWFFTLLFGTILGLVGVCAIVMLLLVLDTLFRERQGKR